MNNTIDIRGINHHSTHLYESKQGNFMYSPVKWFKDPGKHETLRKAIAVFMAFVLTLSVIGLFIVIPGIIEWRRQTKTLKNTPSPPSERLEDRLGLSDVNAARKANEILKNTPSPPSERLDDRSGLSDANAARKADEILTDAEKRKREIAEVFAEKERLRQEQNRIKKRIQKIDEEIEQIDEQIAREWQNKFKDLSGS